MAVKVIGEGRKARSGMGSVSPLADPDPQQLVMAWDQEERARKATAAKKDGVKSTTPTSQKKSTTAEKSSSAASKKAGKDQPKATPAAKKVPTSAPVEKPAKASKPRGKSTAGIEASAGTARAKPAEASNPGGESVSGLEASAGGGAERPAKASIPRGKSVSGIEASAGTASAKPAKASRGQEGRGRRGDGETGRALTPTLSQGERGRRQDSGLRTQDSPSPPSTQHPEPRSESSVLSPQPSVLATNGKNGHGNGSEQASYTGEQIQILEGVQHIRQRPGMYIGTTSTSGLLHLVYEAVDNVVDEYNAGYGSLLKITIGEEGRVTVRDEARGIPIDPKEWGGTVLPTATWIFIKPFTGGKFEPGAYKQAGGLHGVGLTVINALSADLEVDIWRDGQHFYQQFREGQALDYQLEECDPSFHGTQIRWLPDPSIFDDDATYDTETLISRLEATACLNRGLWIDLTYWDEETRQDLRRTLHSPHGLSDFVRSLTPAGAVPLFRQPIAIDKVKDEVSVEVVLQPDNGYKSQMLSFANGVRTPDGGTHESGFKAALTKLVNDYALKWNLIKDRSKESLKPDVIQQGLSVVISVKLADPQFQGQTKNRLNNAPVEGITRSIVSEGLAEWFETNQAPAKEWIKKIHLAQKARNEAQMAEELARTGQKKGGELIDVSLSKKFAACNGNDPARNELFLVEGESAGGSAKQARRSEFQAILALKGKPLNVANASLQRILDNEEIRTIISVIGTGTRHVFDLERLKFHKIILLSDADVDGSHIVCLLLTLFHQEMPGLIENGHVYLGCPPLYSVRHKGKLLWLADDEARKKFLKQHPESAGLEFKRYKGLGEMNASELRETTMDPARRVLKRVTMEDAALSARLVSELMAKENAEARRTLLAKQARHLAAAGNLDV